MTPDQDRAYGLMVGIAVGNLLGIRYEGRSREEVFARNPDGVTEIDAAAGYPDDDDLAQTVVIAEAAAAGQLDPGDLGNRFWYWAETNGAGMGGLTKDVMRRYGGAYPQRLARNRLSGRVRPAVGDSILEASEAAWDGNRAGNGAVMRCAPLVIRWRSDSKTLVRESIVSAVPTHWDRRCGWSCAVLNLAAAAAWDHRHPTAGELIEQAEAGVQASLPELSRFGYEPTMPHSVRGTVQESLRTSLDDLDLSDKSFGYTLTTLEAALAASAGAESFESGLRAVVEQGRDADTNGAAAGAVLGARFGLSGIPVRWRSHVSEIRSGRIPVEWYADRLLETASS